MKKVCGNCNYSEDLPFADELVCMNANSDYADCPCGKNDSCNEWEGKNDEEME